MNFLVSPDLITIEPIELHSGQPVVSFCLRLDTIHPIVSGNKWFKLRPWLQKAIDSKAKAIASFGGAYSNHIVATAYAAAQVSLPAYGFIRGEAHELDSHTLRQAKKFGMTLIPVSRADYRKMTDPQFEATLSYQSFAEMLPEQTLIIPEGGAGKEGIAGAAGILGTVPALETFSHIAVAMGTGTTAAGILKAALSGQQVIGISCLKGKDTIGPAIIDLFPDKSSQFGVFTDYHFGGYAKYNPELIAFMNGLYRQTGIPTDFVYTGKLFAGIADLMQKGYFLGTDRLLLVHTGGLQGNLSLPKGRLNFL